jgi:hypothetical protein
LDARVTGTIQSTLGADSAVAVGLDWGGLCLDVSDGFAVWRLALWRLAGLRRFPGHQRLNFFTSLEVVCQLVQFRWLDTEESVPQSVGEFAVAILFLLSLHLFGHLPQVVRSGLQGIQKKASGLPIDLSGEEKAHDLGENDLDGVSVLEDGEVDGGGSGGFLVEVDMFFAPAGVEEAEGIGLESGRAALCAIDLDMLAARRRIKRRHMIAPPLPPGHVMESGV